MKISDIDFGYSSAETERTRAPNLLLKGYFDELGIVEKAQSGFEFVFLGYKGSGKTAIAQRIELLCEHEPERFVNLIDLKDFPFTPFSKIVKGDAEPESKYPIGWSWLLCLRILQSLNEDKGGSSNNVRAFDESIDILKKNGLIYNENISQIIKYSSKNGFSLKIPKILELNRNSERNIFDNTISSYVDSFKELIYNFKTENQHLFIIDGLDDIITKRNIQFEALGGLIFEIARINSDFHKNGCNIKVICLCRIDIFDRISSPNKNKIKQDSSIMLDWFHDPAQPEGSMLVKAANMRASMSLNVENIDIFKVFFPEKIRNDSPATYLLNYTRHTPRDFFQLLKRCGEIKTDSGRLDYNQITSAIRKYSQDYFLTEIRDELEGYYPSNDINNIISIIEQIAKTKFKFSEFQSVALKHGFSDYETCEKILEKLYECGAVYNQIFKNGTLIYTSKFRNRNSNIHLESDIIVHRGLQKALNLSS